MADRSRSDTSRLSARLRREARAARPAFCAALHDRVVAAASATAPPAHRGPAWRPVAIGGFVAAAACVAAVGALCWLRPASLTVTEQAAVAGTDVLGIERLPTPAEIGAGVLAEVTTLAADAVGLPEWTAIAALDPAMPAIPVMAAPADDSGR